MSIKNYKRHFKFFERYFFDVKHSIFVWIFIEINNPSQVHGAIQYFKK